MAAILSRRRWVKFKPCYQNGPRWTDTCSKSWILLIEGPFTEYAYFHYIKMNQQRKKWSALLVFAPLPLASQHKRPAMWKVCPWHNVIMSWWCRIVYWDIIFFSRFLCLPVISNNLVWMTSRVSKGSFSVWARPMADWAHKQKDPWWHYSKWPLTIFCT